MEQGNIEKRKRQIKMFTIVTTQKILEKLYLEDTVWGNIVAHTKCFYLKLDTDWWEEDDDTPLMQLSNSQADIKDGKDIFDNLEAHPEIMANYPTSAFILDIKPEEAAKLQKMYGVIVQSYESLDDAILTTVSRSSIDVATGETGVGWNDVLNGLKDLPTNAIIINDRNLFSNDQIIKNPDGSIKERRLNGVDNVSNILDLLLPRTLETAFHVLIVCEKKPTNHLTVKELINQLNKTKKILDRPYNVTIELLAVTSGSQVYRETHNRRILTNYGLITFDHAVNAFVGNKSREDQLIHMHKLFSHQPIKDIPSYEKNHSRYIKTFKDYRNVVIANPTLNEHEFAKNGRDGMKFSETEHRMIIY